MKYQKISALESVWESGERRFLVRRGTPEDWVVVLSVKVWTQRGWVLVLGHFPTQHLGDLPYAATYEKPGQCSHHRTVTETIDEKCTKAWEKKAVKIALDIVGHEAEPSLADDHEAER